ncbi:MAG: TraB/GumN family protein, partial [Desulfobacterales bacterium]
WHELAHDYVDCYLCGDLQKLRSKGLRFPSRHQSVIDHRDEIFYKRMQPYLMQGRALAFVGAPHVHGISKMLREDGYDIRRPRLPAAT